MAEILTSDITEGTIPGNGVFDELQKAVNAHLVQEYNKGRITGPEYSEVYLGGLQASIQQAIAFLLGKQKADQEAELLKAKIITEGLVQDKISAEIVHIGKQNDLIDAQIDKINAEIKVIEKQEEEAEAKIWVVKAQVSDDMTITAAPTQLNEGILGRTGQKINAETALLTEKKVSESAQTKEVAHPESILGKETLLRDRQADGFLRDAEQKLSKIVGDSFAVQFTTLDGLGEQGVLPSAFDTNGINSILNKAMEGIGT